MDVASLYVYPVKGCRGMALQLARIEHDSLQDDRRFLVVDERGSFLSQRNAPRMAHIDARASDDELELQSPGEAALRIRTTRQGDEREVDVWGTACRVVDQGEEAAAFFARALGQPARLVQLAARFQRPLHERLGDHPAGRLRFADAAPLLVVSQASLDDLNGRLEAPVEMERFRANIVVQGCEPYAEDAWARITVGDVTLQRLMPCGRCAVTTLDPLTLERGREPLKTLTTYRRHEEFGALFGTYYVQLGEGVVRVGDPVHELG